MGQVPGFIDTHIHLWDLSHPDLVWNWVDTDADHPILGDIDAVKMRKFDMTALQAESRFAGAEGFVHVQAAIGSADPVGETRWLSDIAASHRLLKAIVGHVDLGARDAESVLDRHGEFPLFRGVRDFAIEPYLSTGEQHPAMERSLQLLADRGLMLDLDCEYPNMPAAADLARRHPSLVIALEHIGFPRRRDQEYFSRWRQGIAALAAADNVVCKISGVAMTDPTFTAESLRPWIDTCLELFGPQRCMLGTNWPLDRIRSSYDAIVRIYQQALTPLTAQEQQSVRTEVARWVYRLD